MTFNSFAFLLFLSSILCLYYFLGARKRAILLLISSYAFYMSWKAEYVFLLLLTTSIDYLAGIRIEASHKISTKRIWLSISILCNLGMFAAFRYAEVLLSGFNQFASAWHVDYSWNVTHLVIPIGISFYTFQSIGYAIDVYYKRVNAEKDPLTFALFVSYFPQLLAGPIDKSYHLIPQLKKLSDVSLLQISMGVKLIIWGLFKKMVVADNLAPFVNKVFLTDYPASPWEHVFVVFVFTIQIYADFSGYSDIAIGISNLFGVKLKDNFKQPYFAQNIQQYWQRWHMSLTDWFRDYVFSYISIEYRRWGKAATVFAIFCTFILSGLWHGETLNFIIWGTLHGIYLSLFFLIFRNKTAATKIGKVSSYFLLIAMILLANIFFRAENTVQAFQIIKAFLSLNPAELQNYPWMALPKIGLFFALIMFILDYILKDKPSHLFFSNLNYNLRMLIPAMLILFILLFGQYGGSEFIYFKF